MARADTLARIKAGEGFIYAARVVTDRGEQIKVGFSLMPLRRVYRDLAAFANSVAVQLLGYMPGSLRDELALHNRLYGRPRCVKKGDGESYPLAILNHPAFPKELIFERPDVYGAPPKAKRRAA
jgi:hypothetical protein